MYVQNSWLYSINIFLRNEIFLSNSTLLESSGIDNSKKKLSNFTDFQPLNKGTLLLFYMYKLFTLKSNLIIITHYNYEIFFKIDSIDKMYKSASWLERETGEMFRILYKSKSDTRRLLLDYSRQENPLLKNYPIEGFNNVYYSLFEEQIVYNDLNAIEL